MTEQKPVAWIYERRPRTRVDGSLSPGIRDILTQQPPSWKTIYDMETPLYAAPPAEQNAALVEALERIAKLQNYHDKRDAVNIAVSALAERGIRP